MTTKSHRILLEKSVNSTEILFSNSQPKRRKKRKGKKRKYTWLNTSRRKQNQKIYLWLNSSRTQHSDPRATFQEHVILSEGSRYSDCSGTATIAECGLAVSTSAATAALGCSSAAGEDDTAVAADIEAVAEAEDDTAAVAEEEDDTAAAAVESVSCTVPGQPPRCFCNPVAGRRTRTWLAAGIAEPGFATVAEAGQAERGRALGSVAAELAPTVDETVAPVSVAGSEVAPGSPYAGDRLAFSRERDLKVRNSASWGLRRWTEKRRIRIGDG